MRSVNRFLLLVGLPVVLLVGSVWVKPAWLGLPDSEGWQLSKAFREYEATLRQREELDRLDEVLRRRIQVKKAVAGDLIAGRISFLQAVAWFKHLHEDIPGVPDDCDTGTAREERYFRMVINAVALHMNDHPETWNDAFLEDLRQEAARLLAHQEALWLPTDGRRALPRPVFQLIRNTTTSPGRRSSR